MAAALAELVDVPVQEDVQEFEFSSEYAFQGELHGLEGRPVGGQGSAHYGPQWALLKFSQPVTAPKVCMIQDLHGHNMSHLKTPYYRSSSAVGVQGTVIRCELAARWHASLIIYLGRLLQ